MNVNNSSSGAEALGLCGPVEWSKFFEYSRRIHKKYRAVTKPIEFLKSSSHRSIAWVSVGVKAAQPATKPASFFRIDPSKRKKHNAGVNAGQAVEVLA